MTKSGPAGTYHIGIRPATNLFHAARFGAENGRAPTLAVTINWSRLDVPEERASELFRDLRRRVHRRWKYLREAGAALGTLDDFGAHENPDGRRNTHWSARVPDHGRAEFEETVAKRLRAVTGLRGLPEGALHFQPIHALGGHMKYLTKGVRPDAASYFHLDAVSQGFVSGHGRTFVSRSLGFAARKAAGWKRKRRSLAPQMSRTHGNAVL